MPKFPVLCVFFMLFVPLPVNLAGAQSTPKLNIVTTFSVLADMAQNVAGDAANVTSLIKRGAEIHNYEPTPKDIVRARRADLILWNGFNLEVWFAQFFQNLDRVPVVELTEGITPIDIYNGPYSGKPNPHAWMSQHAAFIYIDNILEALIQYDAINADIYRANATRYKRQITKTLAPIRREFETLAEDSRWLVTSEGAFSYLARDFNLRELFLWPINADQQGTPKQVRVVIDTMREHNIGVIFSESTISPEPAKQIAREVGAVYGGVLYVDSLSVKDGPVPTYVDLLRVTLQTILMGIKQ